MAKNEIWMCKIYLRRENTDQRSRTGFIKADLESIVILDEFHTYVDSKTNNDVIDRVIKRHIDNKFNHTHIIDLVPLKKIGYSQAPD